MRPSADFQNPEVVRKNSVQAVLPKEKKADLLAFQQPKERHNDRKHKNVWGPVFEDRKHFNEMHFC